MPLVELPILWIAILNVIGWPIIHLALAWLFIQMPRRWFQSNWLPTFSSEVRIYENIFGIRRWKDRLPDGAAWFRGGFAKGVLSARSPDYFARFILETRRGEAAHWAMLLSVAIFLLWNPPWAAVIMGIYAISANFPCIMAQRYNRIRMSQLKKRQPRPVKTTRLSRGC